MGAAIWVWGTVILSSALGAFCWPTLYSLFLFIFFWQSPSPQPPPCFVSCMQKLYAIWHSHKHTHTGLTKLLSWAYLVASLLGRLSGAWRNHFNELTQKPLTPIETPPACPTCRISSLSWLLLFFLSVAHFDWCIFASGCLPHISFQFINLPHIV